MAILKILKFPDPKLRAKCHPVETITPNMKQLAEDMLQTMYACKGIGLSAVQVGHLTRLITADTTQLFNKTEENPRYPNIAPGEYEKSYSAAFGTV